MTLPRFVIVGGSCALLNTVLVIVLVNHGLSDTIASVVAFGPVLLVGYSLHCWFTFGAEPSRTSFIQYALAVSANFPLWIAGLFVLCNLLRLDIAIAAPALTAVLFAWNFASAKWIFRASVTRPSPQAPATAGLAGTIEDRRAS